MSDHHLEYVPNEPVAPPTSIRHLVETLHAYLSIILLSLVAVAIGYAIVALGMYLTSPEQHITSRPFRLDFKGAAVGAYPNGIRFSVADIVNTPILLKVYDTNELSRFCSFRDFSGSVFILESNRAYEDLVAEYTSRLSDPKLTSVDRERIRAEFDQKRMSIAQNEYSINFVRSGKTEKIPKQTVLKVLTDILDAWANFAINEQHVLLYRVFLLSPAVVNETAMEADDPVISIVVLRSKITGIFSNIAAVSRLPAAELARTKGDGLTLEEIRLRLEEIVRFRLEPLVGWIRTQNLLTNPSSTARFIETQISYDKRRLVAQQAAVSSIRESIAVYSRPAAPDLQRQVNAPVQRTESETVMPQLSDSFLDRLVALAASSGDAQYRKDLVELFREASLNLVPLEQSVAYHTEVYEQLRGASAGGNAAEAARVRQEIQAARAETKTLIAKVNEIYQDLSTHLNPSTQLFTLTGTALVRVVRGPSLQRFILVGLLVLLLALPLIIVACLLHNRMREEPMTGTQQV